MGHFTRDCPTRDQVRKPAVVPEPEAVKTTTEDVVECITESCSRVRFCVNCGLVDHVASQCVDNALRANDLRPPRAYANIHSFDVGCRALRRPTLTLAKLWFELSIFYKRVELPRPKEWYIPGDSDTLTTYSPMPIRATMDSVDVKFEACVVVDVFLPGICLGPQELKCYNINRQEPTGETRVDERASLVVSFIVPQTAQIPLQGLIDTRCGVSILTFSAFNRVDVQTGAA